MVHFKIFILLAYIAITNAYTISFNLLGYESIFSPHGSEVINEQVVQEFQRASLEAQMSGGGAKKDPEIDWSRIEVKRKPEVIQIDIPGKVGRERCFNIIPPLFSGGTPITTRKDLFKPHNLRQGHSQPYFPPKSLFSPQEQFEKPTIGDIMPYLRDPGGISSILPKAEITKITINSTLDPQALENLGPAGPPPLAIALYAKRDCLSKTNRHAPETVIRYFEGEGLQFVAMDKLYPNTGILEAQSWEELDETSEWWAQAIGHTPIQRRGPAVATAGRTESTGSTAHSNESDEKFTPTRVHPGDAYVSGPKYKTDVVGIGNFGFYTIDEVLDSTQTMNTRWPDIEDYGYSGPRRLDPQVKKTGSEYLDEGRIPETDVSSTEEIDTGSGDPGVLETNFMPAGVNNPGRWLLYNPLKEGLLIERIRPGSVTFKEDLNESSGSTLPPLVPDSSDDGSTPPLEDTTGQRPQNLIDTETLSDFERLDLYRVRSGGMASGGIASGGSNPEQEEDVAEILQEDYVNELDELE
ncbi:hypothetical protein TWF281_006150 [Arthrobotrys megalospora]